MGYTHGDISYKYNIKIDLSSFIDAILEQIDGWNDYEFDGDKLEIYGSTSNRGKSYYSPATLYDPPEYDTEFIESTIDELDLKKVVMNACTKCKDYFVNGKPICRCKLDEDSFEFEPDVDYGPDPDQAYDEWRDRQLEGEY